MTPHAIILHEQFNPDWYLLTLRKRYTYLAGRVTAMKAMYLQSEQVDPYFWWWIDAALELHTLKEYGKRYQNFREIDTITKHY